MQNDLAEIIQDKRITRLECRLDKIEDQLERLIKCVSDLVDKVRLYHAE